MNETSTLGSPCPDQRGIDYAAARRVTWMSIGANVGIGVIKCLVGYWGHSRALVADGIHSLTDLGSDVAVLVGIRMATTPPDAEHPYGHHKATSLVTLLIGAGILLFCALVLVDSTRALLAGTTVVPHWPTLATALLSLLAKEVLFHRTRRVAMESHSTMVLANAWHHRTDSLTSVIAAVGIAVVLLLGPPWSFLDAVIGIAMAGYLATSGAQLGWRAVNDLMDSAPEETVINDLREHVLEVPGANGYHEFRARRVGDMIEADLHLLVPPELSVEEAHQVARRVKHAIQQAHPEVLNVLIHIEPDLPEHRQERGVAELPPVEIRRD
jgi:cation diffusion facilitator family transporter